MFRNRFHSFCLIVILMNNLIDTLARHAIIGGNIARKRQFPYQVSLQPYGLGHNCGGGLIHEQFILTAAHCVVNDDGIINDTGLTVIAGTHDLHRITIPAVTMPVKKIYIPKAYKPPAMTSFADIAVLKLKEPLRLKKSIKLMNLPSEKEKYIGKEATIAGFGVESIEIKDGKEHKVSSMLLKYAETKVLSRHQKGFFDLINDDKQICAQVKQHGNSKHGVCFGDSGGPLVHEGTVIGVLSITPKDCSEHNLGAVYTRVSHYLNFIHDAIHDKHHDGITSHVLHF